jgi:5-methylcytosine-specific restriction enzyme subunit McrC
VSVADVDDLYIDRTIRRYEPIFEYCRWFLNSLSPDVVSGDRRYLSLLFDMNALFEQFVASKIHRWAISRGYRVQTQGPQRRLAVRARTGEEVFVMKPDVSLLDERGSLLAIVDTKWKLADEEDRKLGVSQSDLYQMVSYAHRYGCGDVFLVYPKTSSMTQQHRLEVLPSGPRVHIVGVDLLAMAEKEHWPGWDGLLGPLFRPGDNPVMSGTAS